MAVQPLEKLLPRAGFSIYKLVRMAAKRSMELADGAPPLIQTTSQKTATIALEEIVAGKVMLKSIADQMNPPSGKKEKASSKIADEKVESVQV